MREAQLQAQAQANAIVVAKNAKRPILKSYNGDRCDEDGIPVDCTWSKPQSSDMWRHKMRKLQSEFEAYRRGAEQERAYQWGKLVINHRAARIHELQAVINMCTGVHSLAERCLHARECLAALVLDHAPPPLTVPPLEGSLGGSCRLGSSLSDMAAPVSPVPVTPTTPTIPRPATYEPLPLYQIPSSVPSQPYQPPPPPTMTPPPGVPLRSSDN